MNIITEIKREVELLQNTHDILIMASSAVTNEIYRLIKKEGSKEMELLEMPLIGVRLGGHCLITARDGDYGVILLPAKRWYLAVRLKV